METTGTRDSLHGSVNTMLERSRAAGEDTVFDRMQAQGDKRCQFCEGGIRCSICSQGPCRITAKAPRGVCGIDADGMAMRGFLLQNTMGTAAYTYHAGEVMKTLAQAKPGGTYEIKDWSKLELLARAAGVALEPKDTLAKRVADTIWAEFNRDHHEESPLVAAFAPAPRVEAWRKLGVMPGGVLHENNRCHDELHDQHRRRLRLAGRQGPAPGHRHGLRLPGAARARPGRPVRHAHAACHQGRPRHSRRRLREHRRQRPRAHDRRRPDRRRPRRGGAGQGPRSGRQGPAHRRQHRDRPGARPALPGRRRLRRASPATG